MATCVLKIWSCRLAYNFCSATSWVAFSAKMNRQHHLTSAGLGLFPLNKIPPVHCFALQTNQVWRNVLTSATSGISCNGF
jgi:hypothetical protein